MYCTTKGICHLLIQSYKNFKKHIYILRKLLIIWKGKKSCSCNAPNKIDKVGI